jgi:TolB-like protein/Tfp pilus assembly protein PilF
MSLFNELRRRDVLRVAVGYAAISWLLIQIAGTIFPLFGFDHTPARIVVIVLAIGYLPALIFTWLFRLTPEGFRKEKDVADTPSAPSGNFKKVDGLIMLALVLALGYFVFDKFVLDPQREAAAQAQLAAKVQEAREAGRAEALMKTYDRNSIAVLAFEDMSQEGDQEYLADGIAEELLNLLANVNGLRVISRSSAFSYKNKDITLKQIATELNVAHLLEGSVRKSGNRVRITAQLIEANSDTHLWSHTYDLTLDDIFAVQDEIATAVAEQLKMTLLGEVNTTPQPEPKAYALLLQARYLARQGTEEGYEQSIELYQQALAIDSTYLAAWVGLAANYSNQANKNLIPFDEGYAMARGAAEQALAINPDYAPALGYLGWIAMIYDNDLTLAARYLEQALSLEPSNLAIIGNSASLLFTLGRVDESIALDEYVVVHDPVNPTGHSNLAEGYLAAGRWDEAIASYDAALRLSPDRIGAHYFKGVALLLKGDAAAALAAMEQEEFEVLRLIGQVMAHHALNENESSDSILADLIARYEQDAAYNIAYVMAYRGAADEAFAWLDKAVEFGDPGLSDIVNEPLFNTIHTDPRWLPFMESIGKAPAQLDSIPFEVTLP